MGVLSIASLAIIFAVVRSTTSTASGQTPGASWPAMRPNVHSPLKRRVAVPTTTSTASDQTSSVPAMRPNVHEVHIHKRPHSGMTSTMLGQHSMPEHRPQHRPMMTQKPIPETAPLSGEADTEENTMSQAMSEDMIEDNTMAGQELIDDPESVEAMIEEMSEQHEEMISVHEFKEVLHELVEEAVDKIVKKKAGFLGKLKTAKQNLIAHDGEASVREPQQRDCLCNPFLFDSLGRGNCNSRFNGRQWCYLDGEFSFCHDRRRSKQLSGVFWSHIACDAERLCRDTSRGIICD